MSGLDFDVIILHQFANGEDRNLVDCSCFLVGNVFIIHRYVASNVASNDAS